MYLCVRGQRSRICVLGVSILSLSTILIFDFRTYQKNLNRHVYIPESFRNKSEWYFNFFKTRTVPSRLKQTQVGIII